MSNKWFNRLRNLLLFWALLFFFATLVFLLKGTELLLFFNDVSGFLQLPFAPIAPPTEGFWMVLAVSLMSVLIYTCLYVCVDLKRRLDFVDIILLSKLISGSLYLLFFFVKERTLAYLIGAVADGTMLCITYFIYSRVRRENRLMGIG